MEPLRLVLRVLFAYVLLLTFVRLSGHHTVKHGSPFDFTVALVLGDLIDDAIWAEVPGAQFVVGAGMLFITHTLLDVLRFRAGASR